MALPVTYDVVGIHCDSSPTPKCNWERLRLLAVVPTAPRLDPLRTPQDSQLVGALLLFLSFLDASWPWMTVDHTVKWRREPRSTSEAIVNVDMGALCSKSLTAAFIRK